MLPGFSNLLVFLLTNNSAYSILSSSKTHCKSVWQFVTAQPRHMENRNRGQSLHTSALEMRHRVKQPESAKANVSCFSNLDMTHQQVCACSSLDGVRSFEKTEEKEYRSRVCLLYRLLSNLKITTFFPKKSSYTLFFLSHLVLTF